MILPLFLAVSIKIPALIYGSAEGLDLLSTEYALSQGLVERNPIMKDRTVRITYSLALATGLTWYDVRRQKQGKNTKKIRIAYAILKGSIVLWNIKEIRD